MQGLAPVETYDGVFYSVGLNTKTLTRLPVLALPCRRHTFAPPRRVAPEVVPVRFAREGVGNAGCPMHPQPPVQQESTGVEAAGSPESPGIPARNGFNGVLRALPGDRAFLPPSSAGRTTDLAPASGRQDHTTSPYATSTIV
jgi:hypothetical protein